MGHGQGRDKGHEQGKGKGKEKGEGKGKGKKGKGQGQEKGEGESFQDQEQAKRKSRDSSKGKGLSPSPGTGGGEEAKGDKKGQKAKGEGKAPRTAEESKQRSKQRKEKWAIADRANTYEDQQGYRKPYYHRRKRYPPGQLRSISDGLVPAWKKKRLREGELYSKHKHNFINVREWDERKFQKHVEKMRAEVNRVFFTRPP